MTYCYCMVYVPERKCWSWCKLLLYNQPSSDLAVEFWNDQYELYRYCYTLEQRQQLSTHRQKCTHWPLLVQLYVLRDRLLVTNPVVAQMYLLLSGPTESYSLVIRTLGVDWTVESEMSSRLLLDMQLLRCHMLQKMGLALQTVVTDDRMDAIRHLTVSDTRSRVAATS